MSQAHSDEPEYFCARESHVEDLFEASRGSCITLTTMGRIKSCIDVVMAGLIVRL